MNGYAIIRGGVLDHVLAGKLGFFELGIYVTIHLQCDFRTGVWLGSAPRLVAAAPRGTSLRDVQRGLQTLVRAGFLRSFHTHGARGNFHVAIDKYDVRLGALKGKRLIAAKSEDWKNLCYESCADGVAEDDAEPVAEGVAQAAPSSVVSSQESELKKAAQTGNRPSPSAFSGFRLSVSERQDVVLKSGFPWVDRQAEYRRIDSWLESNPDRQPRNSRRFLHNWFAKIPSPSNGKGVSRAEERTRNNLRAAGFFA
jgi:hypothetical protein